MNKILNFDQFIAEKKKETITVTIFGKEYIVPCEIPANVPVMMARAETEMSGQEQLKLVMQAADNMFGREAVNELCAKGISTKDLADLVQKLFVKISGTEPDEESQEIDELSNKVAKAGAKNPKK